MSYSHEMVEIRRFTNDLKRRKRLWIGTRGLSFFSKVLRIGVFVLYCWYIYSTRREVINDSDNMLPRVLPFVFPQFHEDSLNNALSIWIFDSEAN